MMADKAKTERVIVRGVAVPRLQQLMRARHITQSKLARRADVATYTVWRAVHGEVVAYETIQKFADALDITYGELCGDMAESATTTVETVTA